MGRWCGLGGFARQRRITFYPRGAKSAAGRKPRHLARLDQKSWFARMIVDDLGRIPMSQHLAATLARAASYADAQQHRK